MAHLSPEQLQEAGSIVERLRHLVQPGNMPELDRMSARLNQAYDDAHGALFELRTLNCLNDHHLKEAVLEWPVSQEGKETTKIDLYLPSLDLAVELQNREGIIVRSVQGPSAGLPEKQARWYLRTEFNASLFRGDATEKQALTLCEGVANKCAKKRFALLRRPVWLLTDLSRTDFLNQYGPPLRTFPEYLRDLGRMLTVLIADAKLSGESNYLAQCPNVYFAFHHRWLGNSEEAIVVFPRTPQERAAATALADALHLPLTLVP